MAGDSPPVEAESVPGIVDTTPMAHQAIPMSLPAILRNSKVKAAVAPSAPKKGIPRAAQLAKDARKWEGRRWKQRRENDLLSSNPHIVPPARGDLSSIPLPNPPTYRPLAVPRSEEAPSLPPSVPDVYSSQAGTFSLSVKGIRKTLKSRGRRAEQLVQIVEKALIDWEEEARSAVIIIKRGGLTTPKIIDDTLVPITPSSVDSSVGQTERSLPLSVVPVPPAFADVVKSQHTVDGMLPAIIEIQKSESSLTWIVDSSFERFIVHCIARYRGLVSFSKTTPSNARITYILLPRLPAPARNTASLETPPTTDFADSAPSEIDSHGGWDSPSESEPEPVDHRGEGIEAGDDWTSLRAAAPTRLQPDFRHDQSIVLHPEETQFSMENLNDEADGEERDLSSDDESASSIAMLSLSSSVASLDGADEPPASISASYTTPTLLPNRPVRRPTNRAVSTSSSTPVRNTNGTSRNESDSDDEEHEGVSSTPVPYSRVSSGTPSGSRRTSASGSISGSTGGTASRTSTKPSFLEYLYGA